MTTRPEAPPPAPFERSALLAPLWRGVDLFRAASLAYALVLFAPRADEVARPLLGWSVLAILGAWTGWAWGRRDRGARVVLAEVALACGAVLATRWVETGERIAAGVQTLPVTWAAAAVLAAAVWWGWLGGLLAAAAVGAAGVVVVGQSATGTTWHNIVLLLLLGGVVGQAADSYRHGRVALARALAVEAATRERERLARDIHDSVLQVLAYVQRRGAEIGGAAGELGELAGQQELRLRWLVAGRPPASGGAPGKGVRHAAGTRGEAVVQPDDVGAPGDAGTVDLRGLLMSRHRPRVEVVAPADPVPLDRAAATQLAAAVGAVIDNVERHAGPGARAWVLLEDTGEEVIVTVRDDGVGMAPGRLGEAEAQGRLGVAQSVRGRVADLGGRTAVTSSPGAGTTVELAVPRGSPGRAADQPARTRGRRP